MRTPKGVWGPLRVIWGPQVGYGDMRTPKEVWGPLGGIWGHKDP